MAPGGGRKRPSMARFMSNIRMQAPPSSGTMWTVTCISGAPAATAASNRSNYEKRALRTGLCHNRPALRRLEHRVRSACAVEHWVPGFVGRPTEYKTLDWRAGSGNTWGVVTSVPACSTVPATVADGTRLYVGDQTMVHSTAAIQDGSRTGVSFLV